MSGIVGIWHTDGRPVERAALAPMSAVLAHRGPDGEGLWIEGPVGLACQHSRVTPESIDEIQPLVDRSGVAVVFDGRLDNRDALLAGLGMAAGGTTASDPALVLAAYLAYGTGSPERLTGDFAIGLLDPRRQQLLLVRDSIGICPLYYTRSREAILFASEIKALLAHPEVSAEPDDNCLAEFLLGGLRAPRALTFFKGISTVLPAHAVLFTQGGVVTRRYWDFAPAGAIRLRDFGEYTEAFRAHFERAVERRLRSAFPVAVSLSGGLDSSSIFCVATGRTRQGGVRPQRILGASYVLPAGSRSDETGFLRDIERQYGVNIERVPAGAGFLEDVREAVWHLEAPFLDQLWNTVHPFLTRVRSLGARRLLTGHWADQLLVSPGYLIDLLRRFTWREATSHLRELDRWYGAEAAVELRRHFALELLKYSLPPRLLDSIRRMRLKPDRPWYTRSLRARARRRHDESKPLACGFRSAHARSLYEEARSSHHVRCMEWDNKVATMHGLEMAMPFLDRDLIAFLMSVPGEVISRGGTPKAILREAMRGVIPDTIAGRTWKADFTDLANEGMVRDYAEVVGHFQSGGLAVRMGYVRQDVLGSELARLRDKVQGPGCDVTWRLSDVIGLEIWLEVFFGRNGRPIAPAAPSEAALRT